MVAEPRLGVGAVLPVLSPTNRGRLSAVPSFLRTSEAASLCRRPARKECSGAAIGKAGGHPEMTVQDDTDRPLG